MTILDRWRVQLSEIGDRAKLIDEYSSNVNAEIEALEDALEQMNVGVSVQVVLAEVRQQITVAKTLLGYSKLGDKWCLTFTDAAGNVVPLCKAPRVARVAACTEGCTRLLAEIFDKQGVILASLKVEQEKR